MHTPLVGLTTSRILLAIVVLRWTAAIVPASCSSSSSGDQYENVFSFLSPSFTKYGMPIDLSLSWDAGFFDGSLHLTGDDVYQPPIEYPPDAKTSAGTAILSRESLHTVWHGIYHEGLSFQGASFNTAFTMSVSQSRNHTAAEQDDGGLLFEVVPLEHTEFVRTSYFSLASSKHGNISVEIGKLEYYYEQGRIGLYVSVSPAPTPNATMPAKSTVWIDYDAVGHNLSVYVDADGKPKPGQATLHTRLNICGIIYCSDDPEYYTFGFFASKNRFLPSCQPVVYSWNMSVYRLSKSTSVPTGGLSHQHQHQRRHRIRWLLVLVVLFTVLAAAAALAAVVFVATPCLTSRYRALKMKLKLSRVLRRLPGMPREFKYADVKKATRNFHESMRLGRGGFGAVYKGKIRATRSGEDGGRRQRRQRHVVEVAVKKFTRMEDRSYDDFLAEVAVINRLRHRNVVPLIGWCYENGELLLIYQYMPNGSLDQHLFCMNGGHQQQHIPTLRWKTRYHIVAGVAAALHYIHHEYEHVVLHCDIKSSNIMLDADFNGRLGDFGLARVVVGFDKNSFTDFGVAGTWGFIAPEYPVSHKATRQTDVYAFGVLILEIVTGKRSLGAASDEFPVLTDWVWWLHGQGRLLEAVDDKVTTASESNDADDSTGLLEDVEMGNDHSNTTREGEFNAADATRLLLLGLACSNPNPADRPSMADVTQVIARMVPPPDVPLAKPTFAWPPEGELPLLDDSDDDDDYVGMIYDDESDQSHRWEERKGRDGLALSIGSFEITLSRFRDVGETSLGRSKYEL